MNVDLDAELRAYLRAEVDRRARPRARRAERLERQYERVPQREERTVTPHENVAHIQSAQKRAWREEWPFEVQLLSLDALFADDRYQREPIAPFIDATVQRFDPTLVGTLDVSARSDGTYAILDGLQRTEVLKRVKKMSAWCAVYTEMNLKHEAEFFFRKNRDRRNMHPYYALRARLVAGEQGPRDIFEIVDKAGFRLASGGRAKQNIVAIGAVEEVYGMRALHREESLTPTLATIKEAFYGLDAATEGTIIRGLGRFWQAFTWSEVDYNHLIDVLSGMRPKVLLGYAADKQATSKHPKAYLVAREIIQAYNRGRRREGKLSEQFLDPRHRARNGR